MNKASRKVATKGRVKAINLKRETIKNLSSRQKKTIKGGGGLAGGVDSLYAIPKDAS